MQQYLQQDPVKKLYKVRIGPHAEDDMVKDALLLVKKLCHKDAMIVADIVNN